MPGSCWGGAGGGGAGQVLGKCLWSTGERLRLLVGLLVGRWGGDGVVPEVQERDARERGCMTYLFGMVHG